MIQFRDGLRTCSFPDARLQVHPGHDTMDLIGGQLVELDHGRGETFYCCKDTPYRMAGHDIFHAIEDRLFFDPRLLEYRTDIDNFHVPR